mmetsp:Transcript_15529/g.33557  ORF Transcript_15529/g.33557 Transcript_15529/m.33557 type:complete len:158 (+) Transcript_15529:136-609(+)
MQCFLSLSCLENMPLTAAAASTLTLLHTQVLMDSRANYGCTNSAAIRIQAAATIAASSHNPIIAAPGAAPTVRTDSVTVLVSVLRYTHCTHRIASHCCVVTLIVALRLPCLRPGPTVAFVNVVEGFIRERTVGRLRGSLRSGLSRPRERVARSTYRT